MNILLVYPEYPDTFWGFKHALKFVSKKATMPPLGLLTVAAMLPAEWGKRLVHMDVTPLKDRDILWADMVFISAMSIQKASARQVIDRCKGLGVRTAAGGPLFTSAYEEYGDVDHLVLNEAEKTLPPFLRDLERGEAGHMYSSAEFPDMGESPAPMWELMNLRKYATMALQYSRGCPFNCDFCNITSLFGRNVRTKSKEQVLKELDGLYNRGWRGGVFFVDDNFIGNRHSLKTRILPAIIEWMERHNHPFSLKTEASINLADDEELMRLMTSAGFDSVFVGIETPHEGSLAECSKYQNIARNLKTSIRKIQDAGLEVDGGFIVGFDSDPASIFERMSVFIQESGIVKAMVGLLNAPRGTTLFNRLNKEGRLLEGFSGNNTDLEINFETKMDRRVLVEGYREILRNLYSPREYYQRVRGFIAHFIPRSRTRTPFRFSDIKALFRSMLVIGVIGRERLHYWRLVFWTLFRRPGMFHMAITYSIYGFHFRKVFKQLMSPAVL